MRSIRSVSWLIVGVFAVFALLTLRIAVSPAQEESAPYRVDVQLSCPNQPFRGEAILVTDIDVPLRFECRARLDPSPPDGYTPLPTELQWSVSSGNIREEGAQAVWENAHPGLQTLRVTGAVRYMPPPAQGLFARRQPEIRVPFAIEQLCLIPVRVPEWTDGYVNGFLIGDFPDPTNPNDLRHLGGTVLQNRVRNNAHVYQPPTLFYEVTPQSYPLTIHGHYTLGDFDLDPRFSELTYPRYIAIHPNMLRKLTLFEEYVKGKGHRFGKFDIFYGYRSPAYNLGSLAEDGDDTLKTPFSQHMYGMALDFIIDEDGDLVMDDLNGDGRTTIEDARVLQRYAIELDQQLRRTNPELIGGAGVYFHHDYWERGEWAQSPYLHLDVRGYTREDGTIISWTTPATIDIQGGAIYRLRKPIPPYPFEIER